jgi:hypothetical protein
LNSEKDKIVRGYVFREGFSKRMIKGQSSLNGDISPKLVSKYQKPISKTEDFKIGCLDRDKKKKGRYDFGVQNEYLIPC